MGKTHVDHQAQAYVAPRKVMTEANGNAPKPIANGKPKWGGAEVCPRCSKSVFIAELMRGAGKAWHKGCFTCNLCTKRLDSSMLCEREGKFIAKLVMEKISDPQDLDLVWVQWLASKMKT